MLFDTQSPNRRRFVQVTFAFLALLMGGGLVLFGIGSSTSGGGLADIFNGNSGGATVDKVAEKNAEQAQKILDANPKDEAAAAKLAKARLTIATQSGIDANGQVVKDGGAELITAAQNAWTKYLALGPAKPDASTAILFSSFFASPGVQQYDKAARALEAVLVTRKPSSGLYAQLALYSLASGNADKAKEARARAIELAPTKERGAAIAKQLDDVEKSIKKQQEAQAKAQESAGGDSSGSTTPKLPTLPTLQ